jgi:glycosyltransferase involved in cell wall biosynthesis
LERLRAQGFDLALVIVGSKGWLYDDFFRQLESSPAKEAVVLPGYVMDEDLPAVYAGAALTIMASVYEGFGLPILEAMACGAPVLSSNSSSLPELGGEAARYFDPHDVDGMTEAIRQVLVDRELGEAMRQAGFAQAARFSWARAAEETMRLYEQLIASR